MAHERVSKVLLYEDSIAFTLWHPDVPFDQPAFSHFHLSIADPECAKKFMEEHMALFDVHWYLPNAKWRLRKVDAAVPINDAAVFDAEDGVLNG